MIIEAAVVGSGRTVRDRHVPLAPGTTTLRAIIDALVRLEVAEFAQRQQEQSLLRILTPADLARGVDSGRYLSGGRPAQNPPEPGAAIARACEAFTDGLYFVFVDDVQIEELDDEVVVRPDTRMRLIRLVALAGG